MTEDEYQKALNNITGTFDTLRNQIINAFEIGRAAGLDDMQIGNDIRTRIKGLVDASTIRRMLPDSAKHMKHASEPRNLRGSKPDARNLRAYIKPPNQNQARLVLEEQPKIPPPPQRLEEAHVTLEAEPDNDDNGEILLDCNKFRSDLRIALLNNAKIKLKIRNSQVIAISR